MNKLTFATLAANALATLTIGLAAPAFAAPSGVDDHHDTVSTSDGYFKYPMGDQTPYGTYQHADKMGPNAR